MSDATVKKPSENEIEEKLRQLRLQAENGDAKVCTQACTQMVNIHLERKAYARAMTRALMLLHLSNISEEEKKSTRDILYKIYHETPENHSDARIVEFLYNVTEGSTNQLLNTFLKDKKHKNFCAFLIGVLQQNDKISEIVCNKMLRLIQLEQFKPHLGPYSCLIRNYVAIYLFEHHRGKEALLCKPFTYINEYENTFFKLNSLESIYKLDRALSDQPLQSIPLPAARAPAVIASSAAAAMTSLSGPVIAPANSLRSS